MKENSAVEGIPRRASPRTLSAMARRTAWVELMKAFTDAVSPQVTWVMFIFLKKHFA